MPVTNKYVHIRRSGVDNAVHVSKKHLYQLSFMVKRFILYVPQFLAILIRCIYQLLVNKLLTINEDVLYLNRPLHEKTDLNRFATEVNMMQI